MSLNNFTKKFSMTYYGRWIDYQLMDYEIVDEHGEEEFIFIKSDFSDLVNLYKQELNLDFETRDEMVTDLNSFLASIICNNSKLAGMHFERIVQNHFILKNKNLPHFKKPNLLRGREFKKFDIFNNLSFNGRLRINPFNC